MKISQYFIGLGTGKERTTTQTLFQISLNLSSTSVSIFFLNIRGARSEINPSVYCEIIETNNLQGKYAVAQIVFSQTSELLLCIISSVHSVPFYFFLLQIKQENLPSTRKDFVKAKYQLSYKLRQVRKIVLYIFYNKLTSTKLSLNRYCGNQFNSPTLSEYQQVDS